MNKTVVLFEKDGWRFLRFDFYEAGRWQKSLWRVKAPDRVIGTYDDPYRASDMLETHRPGGALATSGGR